MTIGWGGTEPTPRAWAAGSWSAELRGDELADLTFDGTLIARSIRAVVRDRDWDTVPVEVVRFEEDAAGLTLELRWRGLGAEFDGVLRVSAKGGELTVALELTAGRAFERNRIGLVVLHPPTLAGVDLTVTHPDGSREVTAFPVQISPHQPAFEIAGLAWTADGVSAQSLFSGEVFEMEDQRNWTDASYKTYSTPLAIPFPVEVAAGERIAQTVVLQAERVGPAAVPEGKREIQLVPAGYRVPSFGVSASTAPDPLPSHTSGGDFLLVELEADQANWRAAWARSVREAGHLPLDVRIVASTSEEVHEVIAEIAGSRLDAGSVVRLGAFSRTTHVTEPELWDALRLSTDGARMPAELLGGARSHFTELNREHDRLPPDLPALTFSITPQMHAQDQYQLRESIPMQALAAEQAVRIAAGRPVHVGPVTLRARFNAVATTPPFPEGPTLNDGYGAQHVPGATDPRQGSTATAAWFVSSASALAKEGVASVTFFETAGERGLVDSSGRPTPAEGVFRALADLSGRYALKPDGPLPTNVHVLAACDESEENATVLVANLGDEIAALTLRRLESSQAIELPPLWYMELRM